MSITQYIQLYSVGDYASIGGLAVALVGFYLTITNIRKSKNAVDSVLRDLKRVESIADFTSVLSVMEEIKRFHRIQQWDVLPDRYSNLRSKLISIRTQNPGLTEDDQRIIQSAITQFSSLEKTIDEILVNPQHQFNIPQINGAVSKQIDKLREVLERLRNQRGH